MNDLSPPDGGGRQRGASLIEVLAALAVATIGITALVAAIEAALGAGQLLRERSLGISALGMLLESQRGVPIPPPLHPPLGAGVTLCRGGESRAWLVWPSRPGLAPPGCSEGAPSEAIEIGEATP